ncbi:MAG: type IV toxin-antitoxin system AbiEi family antitoxin domain-containing protein [Candidatus Marsarchaeota archaeon]|nr:type IV toxin-antitoxin system AbiEi family antitoxin domain-containing protein [Candidatus Marsarchaeota archaeon]
MKYIRFVLEHFSDPGFPVATLTDIRTALKPKGISDAYLKRLINYLMHDGKLSRITKGVYTLHNDMTTVGFAFQPFYYGLENALTIRKLWEQGTNPVVITPRKVRTGLRTFLGNNYVVQRIDKELFFGYELVKYYDFWIPVSDIEKTLIDFVYFKHYLRKDVLKELKRTANREKLSGYLKAYAPRFKSLFAKAVKMKLP